MKWMADQFKGWGQNVFSVHEHWRRIFKIINHYKEVASKLQVFQKLASLVGRDNQVYTLALVTM